MSVLLMIVIYEEGKIKGMGTGMDMAMVIN